VGSGFQFAVDSETSYNTREASLTAARPGDVASET
jgi:hypothetical protein